MGDKDMAPRSEPTLRAQDDKLTELVMDVACFAVSYGLRHSITETAIDALYEYIAEIRVSEPTAQPE